MLCPAITKSGQRLPPTGSAAPHHEWRVLTALFTTKSNPARHGESENPRQPWAGIHNRRIRNPLCRTMSDRHGTCDSPTESTPHRTRETAQTTHLTVTSGVRQPLQQSDGVGSRSVRETSLRLQTPGLVWRRTLSPGVDRPDLYPYRWRHAAHLIPKSVTSPRKKIPKKFKDT